MKPGPASPWDFENGPASPWDFQPPLPQPWDFEIVPAYPWDFESEAPRMIGLHINDKTAPYTALIFALLKTLETRFRPTLRPFIGQRVAIIRTGKGPAAIVGTVDIVAEEWIPHARFWDFENLHRVPRGSACDVGTRAGKWAYRMENPRMLPEPIVIGSQYYTGNRTYRCLPMEF